MKMYNSPHALSDYLDTNFECSCGKNHYAALKYVSVGKNTLNDLPDILRGLGKVYPYLICDAITYSIAGSQAMEILKQAGINAKFHQLTHLNFDEATVGELLINKPAECDIAVAVGTGAINDMTRYFSFRLTAEFNKF